jgi:hypothetical protein
MAIRSMAKVHMYVDIHIYTHIYVCVYIYIYIYVCGVYGRIEGRKSAKNRRKNGRKNGRNEEGRSMKSFSILRTGICFTDPPPLPPPLKRETASAGCSPSVSWCRRWQTSACRWRDVAVAIIGGGGGGEGGWIYLWIHLYISIYICLCAYLTLYTHTHIHLHPYIYIYIYMCVCVCMYMVCIFGPSLFPSLRPSFTTFLPSFLHQYNFTSIAMSLILMGEPFPPTNPTQIHWLLKGPPLYTHLHYYITTTLSPPLYHCHIIITTTS